MTLLITGGTGFLGAYFTRYALEEGGEDRVVVLDRYPDRARIADIADRVDLVEGDIADFDLVRRLIADHKVDRIAHYAFILGAPAPGAMQAFVSITCQGTANVLEAAREAKVKRVAFCSSVAAYGRQTAETLTEDLPTDPEDPYGFTKRWAESLGRYYSRQYGLEVVSLRFGSTYGLGRAARGSYRSGVLPPQNPALHYMARVEKAARGEAIVMPSSASTADFTYAADSAHAVWLALHAARLPHYLYNVVSDRFAVGDYTQALREVLPDVPIEVSADEAPGNAHLPMDGTRLREDVGYAPRYNLAQGLADYVERVRRYDAAVAQG